MNTQTLEIARNNPQHLSTRTKHMTMTSHNSQNAMTLIINQECDKDKDYKEWDRMMKWARERDFGITTSYSPTESNIHNDLYILHYIKSARESAHKSTVILRENFHTQRVRV